MPDPAALSLAASHHRAGRAADADAAYRAALADTPGHPAALHGLGLLAHQAGRHDEALRLLREAVNAPGLPPARAAEYRSNLAAVLGRLGRHADAAAALREAVRLRPAYARGWCNLGVALERCRKPGEAADAYRRAADADPADARARHFLGNALRRQGRTREAEAAFRRAVALDANYAPAWSALAGVLGGQGRLGEVLACRRRVAALRPGSAAAGSALLATLHYPADSSPARLLQEAKAWAARHADPITARAPSHDDHDRAPDRTSTSSARLSSPKSVESPLRIGFVSSNFSAHPEGRFARPLLANLDRERFATFCYSNTQRADPVGATLRHLCDGWRDVRRLGDDQAAELIRKDRIDILVDLTGHFGANRLGVFARRPAPVQVVHFGYPGTSGMTAMDWRVTDRYADPPQPEAGDPADGAGPYAPPGERAGSYATERLVGVGELAWCYDPPAEARAVGPLPAARNGYVTFVCVNNTVKVTPEAAAAWAQILRRVPGSRLLLLAEGGRRRAKRDATGPPANDPAGPHLLHELFAGHGVERGRVGLVGRQSRGRYFEFIQAADVALDPFPYNGGVTTADTLWMGVPVVGLAGDAYWSRQAVAVLNNVGLGELVAPTVASYVEAAVALANDRPRLADLRRGLRARVRSSAVADAPGYAARLGAAYRAMWLASCART